MSIQITLATGTLATLLGTELNTLLSNTLALGSAWSGSGGYLMAEFELVVSYPSAPAQNTACSVWLLRAPDGTNYEDGNSSTTPARAPDLVFPIRAVTGAQRVTRRVLLPPGAFKPLLKNDGTGVAMASSGNTLKALPITYLGG